MNELLGVDVDAEVFEREVAKVLVVEGRLLSLGRSSCTS